MKRTAAVFEMQGKKEGLRKLKLKIEDPPRRKHTGVLHDEIHAT